MKNFLKTSMYILAFAVAGVFFQISCSNSDEATFNNSNNSSTEKIVFVKKDFSVTDGQSIWICDLDGSNLAQVPITLPAGMNFYKINGSADHSTTKLSQDGQTLLFTVQKTVTGETYIYSCGLDGTNLQQVVAIDADHGVFL